MRRRILLCGGLLLLALALTVPASSPGADGTPYGYVLERSANPVVGTANAVLGRSFRVTACGNNPGDTRYDSWSGWDNTNSLDWLNGQRLLVHMTEDGGQANGCPWGGSASGSGGGLYVNTVPAVDCSPSHGDDSWWYCDKEGSGLKCTSCSSASAGFSFYAPSGTAIGEVGSSPTFLTQTELSEQQCGLCEPATRTQYGNGSYQSIPHWGAWFSANSTSSANAIRGCYDYNSYPDGNTSANFLRAEINKDLYVLYPHTDDPYLFQCNSSWDYSTWYTFNAGGSTTGWTTDVSSSTPWKDRDATDARHTWYRPLLDSGGMPTSLHAVLKCTTSPCTAFWGTDQYNYNSRMNLKGANVSLVDQQDPTSTGLYWDCSDCAWKKGTYVLKAHQADNTGVAGDLVTPGGAGLIDHADDLSICSTTAASGGSGGITSHAGGDSWYVTRPCKLSRNGSWNVNVCEPLTSGGNPDYSGRTFSLRTYDPAGNSNVETVTANVDCSAPVAYPYEAPQCAADTGLRVFGVDSAYIAATAATGTWLKRGTVQVRGSGCDTSPMVTGTVQLRYSSDNSSWTGPSTFGISDCSFPGGVGAHQDSELRCNFDTSAAVGGVERYPEGTYVQFRISMGSTGGFGYSAWGSSYRVDNTPNRPGAASWDPALSVPNGWTNRSSITASWSLDTNGSPTTAVWYSYQPGPSGAGACAPGAATLLPSPAASSVTLANSPTIPCQQGQHTLNVWQVDASGNGSSTFARTSTYRYDSIRPQAPTAGTVDPSDWSSSPVFQVAYTNPLITNTATESPFVRTFHRIGDQDPVPLGGDPSCLGSGVRCTVTGITVPQIAGAYPYLTWLQDEATNWGEELTLTLRYTDGKCLRS